MATATKADLEARIAELESQLAAPAAESNPLERRKAAADNTTVGIITGLFPIQRKDGTATGGYNVRVKLGAQVNFGSSDAPNRRRITVEELYFTVWDNGTPANPNPVASQLAETMSGQAWACCRLYWEYSASPRAVQVREDVNPSSGRPYREEYFAYAPDRRIFAFDLLKAQPAAAAPAKQDPQLPELPAEPFGQDPTLDELPF